MPQALATALMEACKPAQPAATPAALAKPGAHEDAAAARMGRRGSVLLVLMATSLAALWLLVLALGFAMAWLVWLLVDTRVIGTTTDAGGGGWEAGAWRGAEGFFQG